MKKIKKGLLILVGIVAFTNVFTLQKNRRTVQAMEASVATSNVENLQLSGKSGYLMEYSTGLPIYQKEENKRLPIASMCKIMTLLLIFEGIDAGNITLEEEITVSERAAAMGGSQVFLEANAKYTVSELIKSIVVCSANDSCYAMAERLAGNEAIFVERMNNRARELGAENTLFANCTGLPKQPQYSCAKDVAIMLKELLKHEEYYTYGKVWMDKFQHPQGRYTEIANTNKLVRFYEGCDGGKTGFTNEAGFCLAATAKRQNMRVISVIIGGETSAKRFDDVRTMFDYAFANYQAKPIVRAGETIEKCASISQGKKKSLSVSPERTVYAISKQGEANKISTEVRFTSLKAPIQKGEVVGEMLVYTNGVQSDSVNLLAFESIDKATLWDSLQEIAQEWNG